MNLAQIIANKKLSSRRNFQFFSLAPVGFFISIIIIVIILVFFLTELYL